MDNSSGNLMQNVYASLLAAYQSSTGSSSSTLAFEPVGTSLSNAMFTLPNSTTLSNDMAVEQVSELANFLPTISNGMIATSDRSVDGFYALLLNAEPSPGTDIASFAVAKAAAMALYEPTLNTFELPNYPYHPIFATPPDWYDPTVTSNWTVYTSAPSSASGAAAPPAQPAPAAGTTPVLPPLHWHVFQPAIEATAIAPDKSEVLQRFSAERSISPSILRPELMLAPSGATSFQSAVLSQAVVTAPTFSLNRFSIRGVAMLAQQQAAATTPQPVTASAPTLSFDYCFVRLQRRWLSEAFLSTPGWYVNGYAAGSLSSGLQNAPPAYFDLVPCAFVVVTNVQIQADWSASDTAAMATANAIGPFSLSEQSFNPTSGTLSMSGMQIIGWVCESQPTLPPQSDPALAASAPAANGSSVVTSTAPAGGASPAAPAAGVSTSASDTSAADTTAASSASPAAATTPATTPSNASTASGAATTAPATVASTSGSDTSTAATTTPTTPTTTPSNAAPASTPSPATP